MNIKTKTIIFLFLGIFLLIIGFKSIINFTAFAIVELISGILLILKSAKLSKIDETKNNNEETKECKYCKSSINVNAKICPNCRKTLDFSFGRVMIGLLIGFIVLIIVFYLGFVNNNDAPVEVRRIVCELGLRSDYPYCYYVDTDKLNEILNKK